MSYVLLVVQIIAVIPDLIRAYREIKKIVDEGKKDEAVAAIKQIRHDFKETKDARKFKEDLVALRASLANETLV